MQSALMPGGTERAQAVTAYACSNLFFRFFHANQTAFPSVNSSLSSLLLKKEPNVLVCFKKQIKEKETLPS